MTIKRKITIVTLEIIFFLFLVYIFSMMEFLKSNLSDEELEQMNAHNEKMVKESFEKPIVALQGKDAKGLKEVLKLLPKETVLELIRTLSNTEIRTLQLFILKQTPERINWIGLMFKRLSASEIKRLISLMNKIGEKRTMMLIDAIVQLHPQSQRDVINSLFRLSTGDMIALVELVDEFSRKELSSLFEILADAKDIDKYADLLIQLDKKTIMLLVDNFHKIDGDMFVTSIKDLGSYSTIAIQLLSQLDIKKSNTFVRILDLSLPESRSVFLDVMNKIGFPHAVRSIELLNKDMRLYEEGVDMTKNLKHYLKDEDEPYETIERAINTASRVDENVRHEGLLKLSEQREVKIRRIMKQVDGQQDIYTGNVVEQLVGDYDKVNDKRKFTNILSGSEGASHSRSVSQEDKLLRIKEVYSEKLQFKKDRILDYFDETPINVRLLNEDDFKIKDPDDL